MSLSETQLQKIQADANGSVLKIELDNAKNPIVWVQKQGLISLLTYLKGTEGFEFEFLSDLTAYDDQGYQETSSGRFVIVYNLFSPQYKNRIRVKCRTDESVPTAVNLWSASNWAEREVFDMFGIQFEGHPDLRRILMDYRWEGHPLRKDYPLRKYQIFVDPEPMPMDLLKKED